MQNHTYLLNLDQCANITLRNLTIEPKSNYIFLTNDTIIKIPMVDIDTSVFENIVLKNIRLGSFLEI